MKRDALGDRMKAYENISRTYLTRRIPVIIRLDGKAFHTFTRGLEKPFDKILMSVMQQTMKRLCEEVQGCVFGYTQSDEINLVLTDYATIQTDAWFGYNIQKMASVAASIATVEFNRILAEELSSAIDESTRNGTHLPADGNTLCSMRKSFSRQHSMLDAFPSQKKRFATA